MLCEGRCISTSTLDNLADRLKLATLHNMKTLKDALFGMVADKAAEALTRSYMLALAQSHPGLWRELRWEVAGCCEPLAKSAKQGEGDDAAAGQQPSEGAGTSAPK